MDARTKAILADITKRLPQYLIDNLMMEDPLDRQYDEINQELKASKHIDAKAKRLIAAAEKTQKRAPVVNPVTARHIEEWFAREVGKLIEQGYLTPPDGDEFLQERARALRQK